MHQLRKYAPELYALLEAEVRRQGDLTGFADKLRRHGERNPDRVAPEELTADAVGDALSDRDFLQRLAERNPGVFRRVAEAFTRFLDGLLAKLGRVRDLGSNRYLQDVQAFRDVLDDVLAKYAPRHVAKDEPSWIPGAGAAERPRSTPALSEGSETTLPRNGGEAVASEAPAQTDMPEFRRWFGDSKVVNADGTPRTVYHGTGSEFWAFKGDRLGDSTGHMTAPLGHFFAEDRAKAERYAEKAADYVPADQRVIDAHLSIRNPKRMTLDELMAVDSQDEARALRSKLEREGHDGIHVPEIGQWVAFEPTQIKSASENRGSFDPENQDIRYSRSAMKSVDANERRGAEAMTRALLDRTDQHRAMYRNGLGWVDFVWGDDGTPTGRAGTSLPGRRTLSGKGLAHLIGQRVLKDGMTRDEAERVAQQMVTVIARGQEVARNEVNGNTSITLAHGDHEAMLVKRNGSNTWLLTGWVKKNPDSSGAGYVAAGDTLAGPSHTRPGEGAGTKPIVAPAADDGNGPAFSRGDPGERDLAGDTRAKLARMQASEARRQVNAGRAAVLSKLAADGYPLGAPGWQQNTGRWEGVRGTLHEARVALQETSSLWLLLADLSQRKPSPWILIGGIHSAPSSLSIAPRSRDGDM